MTDAWNDVGDHFTKLGQTLKQRWQTERGTAAENKAEVDSAFEKVKASLDDLAEAITRTANDVEIRRAARDATGGVVSALSASLDQLAAKIQQRDDSPSDSEEGTAPTSGDR